MKIWNLAFLFLIGLGLTACSSENTEEQPSGTDSTETVEVDVEGNPPQEPSTDVDEPLENQAAAPNDFEAVAKAFIQAKARLEFDEAKKYVTGNAVATLNQVEEEMAKLPAVLKKSFKKTTVNEVECREQNSSKRVCQACCNTKGQRFAPVQLVLKEGAWRVAAF